MGTKNQQELLKFLGPEYSIKTIDGESCLYRKINSSYDIEISGTTRKNRPISVFVWDITKGEDFAASIVEKHFDISDWASLKTLLDTIIQKYRDSV